MINQSLSIAVVGIGGIGGILASLFSRKGYETIAVSSKETVDDIRNNGLTVSSSFFGSFKAYPEATTMIDRPIDVIFFTTKYPYLMESFQRVQKDKIGKPLFISLLNGLGSRNLVIKDFGDNFITGSIGSIEVFRDKTGIIKQPINQAPVIDLAKELVVTEDCFKNAIDIIESIGISISIYSDHNEVIWRKLARLGAIASSTAAFQKSIGEIREDKAMRKVLIGLINEGSMIANSIGVKINKSKVIEQVDLLPHDLKTSLSRDLVTGKPSEIHSITIAIIDKAKEKNISTPVYESFLNLIKEEYAI